MDLVTITLARISQVNLDAILFMEQGKNESAVEKLQRALVLMTILRRERQDLFRDYRPERGAHYQRPQVQTCMLRHTDTCSSTLYPVSLGKSCLQEQFLPTALYNRAFAFSGCHESQCREIFVAVLFNLALANQRLGLETGNSFLANVALSLYHRACLSILTNDKLLHRATGATNLLGATVYNMAVSYAELWQPTRAQFLRSKLLQFILETYHSHDSATPECQRDLEFFYVNLSFAQIDSFRLAPAA